MKFRVYYTQTYEIGQHHAQLVGEFDTLESAVITARVLKKSGEVPTGWPLPERDDWGWLTYPVEIEIFVVEWEDV